MKEEENMVGTQVLETRDASLLICFENMLTNKIFFKNGVIWQIWLVESGVGGYNQCEL